MKQIRLQWTYYADIISVPDRIAENLSHYQLEFDKWMNDPKSIHNYLIILEHEDEGFHECLSFNSDAFIDWLNQFILKDDTQKAEYVLKDIQPTEEQKSLPTIHF